MRKHPSDLADKVDKHFKCLNVTRHERRSFPLGKGNFQFCHSCSLLSHQERALRLFYGTITASRNITFELIDESTGLMGHSDHVCVSA